MEWMIQFALCTMLGITAFALFRTWAMHAKKLHQSLDQALQLPLAYELLRRDLMKVQPQNLICSTHRCVIKFPGQQLKWYLKDNILYRSQKSYNTTKSQWNRAVKNVVAEKVSDISFKVLMRKAQAVSGVGFVSQLFVHPIGLRNGTVI